MKQTQTHVWSLAGEEAVSYSLARGKAAAVTRESGEVAAYSLARAVSCIASFPGRPFEGGKGLGTTACACAKDTVYFPYNTP